MQIHSNCWQSISGGQDMIISSRFQQKQWRSIHEARRSKCTCPNQKDPRKRSTSVHHVTGHPSWLWGLLDWWKVRLISAGLLIKVSQVTSFKHISVSRLLPDQEHETLVSFKYGIVTIQTHFFFNLSNFSSIVRISPDLTSTDSVSRISVFRSHLIF